MNAAAPFTIRPATTADTERVAHVVAVSFTVPEDDAITSVGQRPIGDYRVVVDDGGKVVGAAFLHFMGQYFGGRRVPCLGVGSVAIAPEARGRGAGRALVAALTREGRERGYALSALYPSTQPLYRSNGFEHGGRYTRLQVPISCLPAPHSHVVIEEVDPAQRRESLRALYFAAARTSDGHLDRSDAIWSTLLERPGRTCHTYLLTEHDAPAGYVVLANRRTEGFAFEIDVLDHVVTSRASLAALYRFLSQHASLATAVQLVAPPTCAFVLGLREQRWDVVEDWRMLLRIVDVEQAFAGRAWPSTLRAQLDLELTDALVEEQATRWCVTFEGGNARITRGGRGAIKLDVRALAALYGATADPAALAAADLLKAPAFELDRLREVFRGPMASARDFF